MTSQDALENAFGAVVGADHVTVADTRRLLTDVFGPGAASAEPALARTKPGSVEELQAVMRIAAERGLSVWSTPNASANGAHFGNGDKPAVLVDLSRLDRILDLDAESACALVEPGVSFDQLRAALADRQVPFWVDCGVNGAHSVSGSICERAFGYTPYGDHVLMQCGLEVVLASGGLMRTGMGALPGSDTWQLFKYNFGPYLDGLFSRSSIALVSKAGLWMMPSPPAFRPFAVTLPDLAAVAAAVETLRPHKIGMTVPNTVVISDAGADAALLKAAGEPDAAPGAWTLYGALYGLPANVAFLWDALAAELAGLPGASVVADPAHGANPAMRLRTALMRGVPAYSNPDPVAGRVLSITAAAPLEGHDAASMHRIAHTRLAALGVPFVTEFALTWRTLLCRIDLPGTADDYAARRTAALATASALADAGYGISHDSPDLTAAVAGTQTGAGLAHLYDGIARALDPGAVLGARRT